MQLILLRKQNSLNQKTKFQMLVVQQQKLHSLQLKIKYLIFAVQLKTNCDAKISELEKDHNLDHKLLIIIMTNMLLLQTLILQLLVFLIQDQHKDLIIKTVFDNKLSSINRKITANKAKYLLAENELKKLKTFYQS